MQTPSQQSSDDETKCFKLYVQEPGEKMFTQCFDTYREANEAYTTYRSLGAIVLLICYDPTMIGWVSEWLSDLPKIGCH